jgi:A/G-specific adenine glycosylase
MEPDAWKEATDLALVRKKLLAWYRQNARDLPWRRTRDPYHIWISEIMLQQTTVATVRGYFERFLERFPTISDLASAREEEVLHLWQGLGYYRRARHLHRAAQIIVRDFGGQFPTDPDEIRALPGLGKYTANAIACFALNQPLPIIEANTRRLWTRLTAAAGNPAKPPLETSLWQLAQDVLPKREFADFNQGVMDLGSMICTPKSPACDKCPLAAFCVAHQTSTEDQFPQLAPRRAFVDVEHVTVLLWDKEKNQLLVTQRPDDGPWAGLWEFPRVEKMGDEEYASAASRALKSFTDQSFRIHSVVMTLRHGIMHYKVTLTCFEAELLQSIPSKATKPSGIRWVSPKDLLTLPFSSPQRRIIARILKHSDLESRSRAKSRRDSRSQNVT